MDDELVGVWRQKIKDGVAYYHVGRLGGNAPSGVMRVVCVAHPDDGEIEKPDQLLAFCSKVGAESYLNVSAVTQEQFDEIRSNGWKDGLLSSYMLVHYRFDGHALRLRAMDANAKRKAIEDKKVQGDIDLGTIPPLIRFTDTTKNINHLVASAGDSLFTDKPLFADMFWDAAVRLQRVQ